MHKMRSLHKGLSERCHPLSVYGKTLSEKKEQQPVTIYSLQNYCTSYNYEKEQLLMKTKRSYYLFLHSAQHYRLLHVTENNLQTRKNRRIHRQNPAQPLLMIPVLNLMIYISRKTSFLQIIKMYGIRYLA